MKYTTGWFRIASKMIAEISIKSIFTRMNTFMDRLFVVMQEREASARLFKSKEGQQLAREIGKRAKTFVPGAPIVQRAGAGAAGQAAAASASAKQNIDAIKVCRCGIPIKKDMSDFVT